MLEVKNISKSFKKDFWAKEIFALRDVSFSLKQGTITGFLGANGAGKTTFLKILLGFISSKSGVINWSESFGIKEQLYSKIGYMPERPYYYPHLTGREFLHYCGELHDIEKEALVLVIEKMSKTFGINHALDTYVKSYSKGMLQRLGFSSALLHNPDLVILDEPLSGLDPIGRRDFKNIILALKNDGKTVFFSSHIVGDVEEVCENVVVLESGEIVYSGAIESLIRDKEEQFYAVVTGRNSSLEQAYSDFLEVTNESYSFFHVPICKKDDFVKFVLSNQIELESLKLKRPTLEEIIYKIKSVE